MPVQEAATYALSRQRKELERLTQLRDRHGEELAADGFSPADFDELIALKRARYEYLQADPNRVREVMEVFTQPLFIIRGTRPSSVSEVSDGDGYKPVTIT